MARAKSVVDAVHTLTTTFGASFAPGKQAPHYEVRCDGTKIRVTTNRGELAEHAAEWKRLCGRLWAEAWPRERDALAIQLPTLSAFESSVWSPMAELIESDAVAAALGTLEASLAAAHPLDALYVRHSAAMGAFGGCPFETKKVKKTRAEAFAKRGGLRALELVKVSLQFIDSKDPVESLQSLFWTREAMQESPANLLGIHRLLVKHVVPLCREPEGLPREGAMAVIERWVPHLVVRAAYPEATTFIDLLLDYGVATTRFVELRYECLLGLNRRSEADDMMGRLRAIADPAGYIRFPLMRYDQYVDDVRAMSLQTVAKTLRAVADGKHPFSERRMKNESAPPNLSSSEAAKQSREYATEALAIFERLSANPPETAFKRNYEFHINLSKRLLA